MVTVDPNDVSCGVFGSITGAAPGKLLRFVVGEDKTPSILTTADMERELNDPFATLLLRQGKFPATADELLAGIDAAIDANDPLSAQLSFVLGEDSQLPPGSNASTSVRFLVSRGSAPHGPELILSAGHPQGGLVEVMAWDVVANGFNYYRTLGDNGEWVFAGNSRHALSAPTQGKGPFESHPSGNLLMKEFKIPWVHWHSFRVDIRAHVFPEGDIRRTHPWFLNKKGAETAELSVMMPTVERWTSARFDQVIAANGAVADPARVIEQIVTTPTVNLTSSDRESAPSIDGDKIDLPPTFFIDSDGLGLLGLPTPPTLEIPREVYAASLERFGFTLRDGSGFERKGDTHFAFVVPERAFEDLVTQRHAIARGLVTERLVAALLMVDFPNPVFSSRRAQLLAFAPPTAIVVDGGSTLSEEMAQGIIRAASASTEGSPEREFAELWAVGDNWRTVFAARLDQYYAAIQQQLTSQTGFDDYTRLAESRRNRVRQMPIGREFELMFSTAVNIGPPETLVMDRDATVKVGV